MNALQVVSMLLVFGLAVGCGRDADDETAAGADEAETTGADEPETPASTADSVDAMVARACAASPCASAMSRVTLFRDASGEVAILRHAGDPMTCSHPPWTYVSPAGEIRLQQGNRPVTGPDDAAQLEAARQAVVGELTADEQTHRCPGA